MTLRILVVDDDPPVLAAVSQVLDGAGYLVDTEADSREGLRRAIERPPDLVVLDVQMPGLTGWELCEILRRQSHTRDVPVLFLTGRAEIRDRITAMQVGGSEYLAKPFSPDALRSKVESLVGQP